MIASEERFGVKVSDEYKFIIVAGPVGPYYATPLRLKVEREYVRAARGGTGYAKCGGNYGGAFLPTQLAKQDGYDQVMWTDATDHKYIEECGTMNLLFRINDLIVTPTLSSSILDGVTRDSILTLAGNMDFEIEKRQVSVEEISEAFKGNIMREAFGAGTAAVVAPVQTINIDGEDFDLPAWNEESFMMQVKLKLSNIRRGVNADNYEWNYII
jgi:branched-chain amino acid aminotransferase